VAKITESMPLFGNEYLYLARCPRGIVADFADVEVRGLLGLLEPAHIGNSKSQALLL
jgi:hypothetical protein